METIAEFTDRNLKVSVTSGKTIFGWDSFEILISNGPDCLVRISEYDTFPLTRLLYQAYEVVQKEEAKDLAAEAVPA